MFSLQLFANYEYFYSLCFILSKTLTLTFKQYLGRRRHRLKNNGTGQEESKDLNMQATATATPTTVKERTSLLNKASNLFRELNQW